MRDMVFYPEHKCQYDAMNAPTFYPVPWNVNAQSMIAAIRNRKECDFAQELLSVTQDLDFVFQLPPVPKADTEKISKFGRETDGRNVDEFITQVERTIHAQKLGQEHYEHKVNVVMNNVSVARQAEITAYRDSCTIEWAGKIPHNAWEKFKLTGS